MILPEIVAQGDVRKSLEAIRNHLAVALAGTTRHRRGCTCECGPARPDKREVAALAEELVKVIERIEKLPSTERRSLVDDLTARRTARLADASGS